MTKSSEQIRNEFMEFFREKSHEIVPSDSLVPKNDPTLLFTNAGMNQFKDVFLGTGTRPYVRAADTQKCLRVSGKHNDLEEVGVDTYHHTFFEMLGNWSFGDYFKKEAIGWAWELLVERWGLDPTRLYATVHEGDDAFGLGPDDEAAEFWKSETSIRPEHILYCSSKDNFWMMGDTGPCGPCSEIHIDLRSDEEREKVDGRSLVNKDDPRVMEIWNLVFIQYNAVGDGTLEKLAAQHVDTGMGFERIVAVLQGKSSNYDTDLFTAIIDELKKLQNQVTKQPAVLAQQEVAWRVIADHIRTVAFAIADGASPGNTGRGYVIRRILRRAVRFGYQTLGFREAFMFKLIPALVAKMGGTFPELGQQQDFISRVVRAEEESFLETLGTGISIFERVVPEIRRAGSLEKDTFVENSIADSRLTDLLSKAFVDLATSREMAGKFYDDARADKLPGEIAFLLHDTYGFPIDLTQLMARESDLEVNMTGYNLLMGEQRERARAAMSFGSDTAHQEGWTVVTSGRHSTFVGYDTLEADVQIVSHRTVQAEGRDAVELILNVTPFYAESGGQVGDTGHISFGPDTVLVLDTQKFDDSIVHIVDTLPGDISIPGKAYVDGGRRGRIKKNHTATHLLHAALRKELGSHVVQKGSLVAPDRLRFDFSHYEKVGPELLHRIENEVNEAIQRDIKLEENRTADYDSAIASGAMALFGEKYGDKVRVVTFDPQYSVELCGGTHVDATGEIGIFKFLSEGSVAAGVRRIEAVTGMDALEFVNQKLLQLDNVEKQFKSLQNPVEKEVENLVAERRRLQRELATVKAGNLQADLNASLESGSEVSDVTIFTHRFEDVEMSELRDLAQQARQRLASGSVLVLGSVDSEESKVYLAATVTEDITDRVPAGRLVGALAKRVGGGGGGKPDLATAGGRDVEGLSGALADVNQVVAEMLAG